MQIEIKSSNKRVSELLAITAMTLLLIHIIDAFNINTIIEECTSKTARPLI